MKWKRIPTLIPINTDPFERAERTPEETPSQRPFLHAPSGTVFLQNIIFLTASYNEKEEENKMDNGKTVRKKKKGVVCIAALFGAYFMTAVMLLILALLLYRMDLDESKIAAGILIVYIVSGFVGGFIAGKGIGSKKYLWGMLVGLFYFAVLTAISAASGNILLQEGMHVLTTVILCAGSGMMGGMLS